MKSFLWIVAGILASVSVSGQDVCWEKAEKLSAASLEKCMSNRNIYPVWIKQSNYFYYDVNQDGENRYFLVNARTGRKERLIKDNSAFVKQYATFTGDTLDCRNLQVYGITFEPGDATCFYLNKKGKHLKYDIRRGELREVPIRQNKKEESESLFSDSYHSSDSAYTMMGCGYNLFVRDNARGNVSQITFDGGDEASYTFRQSTDTVVGNCRGFWIGHRYVYLMQDMSQVKELSLINSLTSSRPRTLTFKMPMPGDEGVRQYRLFWYNADTGEARMLPIEKYADQVVEMNYYRSDKALYFTRRNRRADRIDLCRVNLLDGSVDELITEMTQPHMNLSLFNYKIVNNGKHIIWWSERTGRGNYYLYDGNGKLLNRITRGEQLVAGPIIHVDSLRNEILFAGYGNEPDMNPYYTFYYKASMDGRKQQLLTPGNGNHELTLSDDRQFAIDRYSRMDCLPVVHVLSISRPDRNYLVEQTDDRPLRQVGWIPPVLLKLKAADGVTDLYGVMYLPSHLDRTRKYPIITNVYPGPQDDQIPQSFVLDDNGNQSLAELGFVVINVATRGSSPLRGRDFYCFGYGNLRDYPLADTKYIVESLAHKYPFIDLDRVGIYGHSGGAFQTVAAMLTYPDFFKVGVAASGNHDNNIYIQWWGEVFHGLTETVDTRTGKTIFSSKIPTNMELASNLKGRLLLITGDVDKNVPPSSTYRLAHALIQANKRFDMFILPGKDHGVMDDYYLNLIRYYFVENLLHPEPRHIDIINHQ